MSLFVGVLPTYAPTVASIYPAAGDTGGGCLVSITGTSFSAATAVKINGVACTSVHIVSDTLLTCLTPALVAGTYNVTVTNALGTGTLAAGFESMYPTQVVGARVYDSELGVTTVGGLVSVWADQGAGAKNASQGNPLIRPVYSASRFGGNTKHGLDSNGNVELDLAADIPFTSRTVVAVVKWIGAPATGCVVGGPGAGPNDAAVIDFALDATAGLTTLRTFDADAGLNYRSPNDPTLADGSPRVVAVTHDGGTGALKFYIDSVQQGATLTDTFGAGRASWDRLLWGAGNPFGGECATILVHESVLSGADLGRFTGWAHSKFVGNSYGFDRLTTTAPWIARDGAGLLYLRGAFYLMGGWNNTAPFNGNTTTNEVWTSVDGITWYRLLEDVPTPPQTGVGARWRRRHAAGFVVHAERHIEYLYVVGGDPFDNVYYSPYPADVWRSLNGKDWERVADGCAWGPRVFHMTASYNGNLYVMGGQTDWQDPTTALQDMWESTDAGLTWHQLSNAGWAKRGLVFNPVEYAGKLWVIGGGTYDNNPALRTYYNDVWSWDGSTWTQVLANGVAPWQAREYHNVRVFDGKLWVINGYNNASGNLADAWTSTDGVTWVQQTIVPWNAGHADGFAPGPDFVLHATGNALTQSVFRFRKLS